MNLYLIGTTLSIIVFTVIGIIAGNKVKDINDYYVAGRRAPTLLIVGSLIASFLSTGAFMGDTGEVYSGFFMGIVIVGIIQASGYVFGAGLFGKFIRRIKVNTVPEYFGKRFNSVRLRKLASMTLIIAVASYLLSAIQGISSLMKQITGLEYKLCVVIAWAAFTGFTVYSGSMGVLITDTIMFLVFLSAAVLGMPYIIENAGGWVSGIKTLATSSANPGIISWTNNLDYLYPTGVENLIWALVYGVVWAIVVMVSPWQTSRYLMAKNEHTVMRASVWASIGVVSVTMMLYFSAAFVYAIKPDLEDPSTCIIWAAMHCMPVLVGIIMLTGIMSAGISSASTFLSLIGTSLTNDILQKSNPNIGESNLRYSRIIMGLVSVLILVLAYFQPPQIFWIMYFGGTVIASAWGVVAITSVWFRNMSESSAFYGMLFGFLGCVITKGTVAFLSLKLPIYLDPFFVGMLLSIIGMYIGQRRGNVSEEMLSIFDKMHVRPDSECVDKEDAYTHRLTYLYLGFSILLAIVFVCAYAIPYSQAVK